jgi:hypothetical protein
VRPEQNAARAVKRLWVRFWAIKRSTKQVLQFEVPYRDIVEPRTDDWHINGPGHFEP